MLYTVYNIDRDSARERAGERERGREGESAGGRERAYVHMCSVVVVCWNSVGTPIKNIYMYILEFVPLGSKMGCLSSIGVNVVERLTFWKSITTERSSRHDSPNDVAGATPSSREF